MQSVEPLPEKEAIVKQPDATAGDEKLCSPAARGSGRCQQYFPKKRRFCPLSTRDGNAYCSEHMVGQETTAGARSSARIPCPYDPTHSVDLHKLKKHMSSLCNARPPEVRPAYTKPDYNVVLLPSGYASGTFEVSGRLWRQEALARADARMVLRPGERLYTDSEKEASSRHIVNGEPILDKDAVNKLLRPVLVSYLQSVTTGLSSSNCDIATLSIGTLLDMVNPSQEFPVDICTHSALDERRLVKTNQKHALQQASLIGHLEKRGLLDTKYAFVEFGAGKGELSVYVHTALSASSSSDKADPDIYLVDRKIFRQKFKVSEPEQVDGSGGGHRQQFRRIYIDIRDLDLASVDGLRVTDPLTRETRLRPIVAYSKHLCGAATDLTIRCLERYQLSGGHVAGIAIALCCHHACRYSMYVDHKYLSFGNAAEYGSVISRTEWSDDQRDSFRHLVTMSSWAINQPHPLSQSQDCDESAHYSGLSYGQRVKAGHAVKRFLDIGRAHYVRRQLSMDDAELVYYTHQATSLENLALLATKIER